MSLYKDWQDLIDNAGATDQIFREFWDKYSNIEMNIYTDILKNHDSNHKDTFEGFMKKYDVDSTFFMGFLDGINSSLNVELFLEDMTKDEEVSIDIDFEKLYQNMLLAEASHLYNLEAWDFVFSKEKRDELTRLYKKSKTVVKASIPGRNDPCSCGSGKKYKKCCGQ